MKLDRLETHDRLEHFKEDQALNIAKGAEDCLKRNKLSLSLQERCPYIYLFAHPRTAEDGVTKIMYWQPRLTKPEPQTNSYLFRATSKTDIVEVCWLLPPTEQWKQYKKGNVTEHETVIWSIEMFLNHKAELEKPDPRDLSDEATRLIYQRVVTEMNQDRLINDAFNQGIVVPSPGILKLP